MKYHIFMKDSVQLSLCEGDALCPRLVRNCQHCRHLHTQTYRRVRTASSILFSCAMYLEKIDIHVMLLFIQSKDVVGIAPSGSRYCCLSLSALPSALLISLTLQVFPQESLFHLYFSLFFSFHFSMGRAQIKPLFFGQQHLFLLILQKTTEVSKHKKGII